MKPFKGAFSEILRPFRPLAPYFARNAPVLIAGLASLLLVDLLQLLIPRVIKRVVDLLTTGAATARLLIVYALIILAMACLIACFRYAWRHFIFGHSRLVEQRLRNRIYGHLQTLSYSFYQRTRTGDLMARTINDINAVRMATGMGLVALTDGVVLGLAAVGFMMSISIKLTLLSLIPAPVVVVFTRVLTRRMSAGFESVQKSFSDLTERVRETFAGIRVIKTHNRQSWAFRRVREEGERYMGATMGLAKVLAVFFPMMSVVAGVGLAVVILFGGRLTIEGDITTGDFVAFTSYLAILTWPLMAVGWVANLIQRGAASMRRINRVLDEVPEIADSPDVRPVERIEGRIRMEGFSYTYPGQDGYALRDVHFLADTGETVALVGRVGSGKSTLLQAIPRLIDVPGGVLFVDGIDALNIPIATLRGHIGFVPQEVFLFSDTIRNNVVFGRTGVSDRDLEDALRAADVLDEVRTFDNGVDTVLGERGVTLSGGQRQRLTIARALLADPAVLILDDALSMVDTRTERRILNRLASLRRHRTTLIVSHRISTISRIDRIVVLDRGTVVQQGTHESLMEEGGLYGRLYERGVLSRRLERRDV